MYAHEEFIQESGLSLSDLPKELKLKVDTFNRKKRMTSTEKGLESLNALSEEIADEISIWYVANNEGFEDDEEEEEDDENEVNPPVNQNPIIVENPQNINSHQQSREIEEEEEPKKKGFGLGFLSNW